MTPTKTPREKIHELIKQNYNENTARCVVALVMPVFDALLEEARQDMKNKISIEVQERVDSGNNVIDVEFEEFIQSL
jgi:hypothetical protein